MRKHLILLAFLILLILIAISAMQPGKLSVDIKQYGRGKTEPLIDMQSNVPGVRLHRCYHEGLGAYYACDFSWRQKKGRTMVFAEINEDPWVRMTVLRIGEEVLTIRQLNRDWLTALGRYAEGFVIEETEVAGQEAIKVKAFALEKPDERLCDYYFVRRRRLYSLMFAVSPKSQWDEYKFLFEDMVRNFAFK